MLQNHHHVDPRDKENEVSSIGRQKVVGSGLKQMVDRGASVKSGKGSPAASPSSKKMRLMQEIGRPASTPVNKTFGLKDITNSALKSINSFRTRQVTDSIAPRLLESKKRPLSSLAGHSSVAPPSKLHIMNTASELDFSSMPDDQLPDIEFAPIEPKQLCEDSEDEFDQFDFSFLTQQPAPPAEPLIDLKKAFEECEFESELGLLSVADKVEESSLTEGSDHLIDDSDIQPLIFFDIPDKIFANL